MEHTAARPTRQPAAAFDRREAVRILLAQRGDLLVVTGLGSATYDVFAAGDHDANFYLWGAMGGAALTGLGLAYAYPRRPVLVITGDGEQLMGLGGLATIAVGKPANLSIAVLDNGHFGETGMQRSHAGLGVDLAAMAAVAGFAEARSVTAADDLRGIAGEVTRAGTGPRLFRIPVHAENLPRALPARDGVYLKNRFRAHLGHGVN
ncbi:thiamine pyrophosphate-dependent enzyme [Cupriavidus sp. 30B13]|uniref:thiamine pyrophosphate-dependent enzyme n=1 Tax=Cupriavidus sp. 30B13 TaxID=3384241 RepID=UPI003B901CBD